VNADPLDDRVDRYLHAKSNQHIWRQSGGMA
jgi:hypothetical protein